MGDVSDSMGADDILARGEVMMLGRVSLGSGERESGEGESGEGESGEGENGEGESGRVRRKGKRVERGGIVSGH